MTNETSKTLPNKRDTLDRLLASARENFALKGLDGARIEDIAREAGVTKQLVYHYYGSKASLFSTVLEDVSTQIMEELIELDTDNLEPDEALRKLLYCCFDQYMNDPLLGTLALEGIRYHESQDSRPNNFIHRSPALANKFSSVLERGISNGTFRPDIDARLFLATSSLLMSGAFTNHYSMSALVGFDTRSDEGMRIWREHSANFILASISQNHSQAGQD
ncbi:TetR/AcrR family transcriptional regulator [Marinobacter salarius]|jgi:AcrR family transcriptional regulator|uniref:TetR/AcrR family transcriptional regulator n=1 Tax=Marinobacter salarius TaxID=1420917 RepID=UPI00273BE3CE|nr:TetR/AcrR family transcriptional regulator [Marinobacter salarius]MDP4533919.1 TetR/AcrR family transcriptional regulator [Marinobacter salarius]|tara:strand:- start:14049 stop:14708 length:660 start_codon:yes stop_codon:yes gene_type:complete